MKLKEGKMREIGKQLAEILTGGKDKINLEIQQKLLVPLSFFVFIFFFQSTCIDSQQKQL